MKNNELKPDHAVAAEVFAIGGYSGTTTNRIALPAGLMEGHLVQATEALTRRLVHEAPESLDRTALVDEMVLLLTGYVQPGAQTGS